MKTHKYTFKNAGTCYFWKTKAPARNAEGLTRGFHDKTNQLYDKPEKQVRPKKSNLTGVYHDKIKNVVKP